MRLQPIDWVVVVLYILFVLGIGVLVARRSKTGDDLFGPDFHRLERASFLGARQNLFPAPPASPNGHFANSRVGEFAELGHAGGVEIFVQRVILPSFTRQTRRAGRASLTPSARTPRKSC
jgi:hypothetical protein